MSCLGLGRHLCCAALHHLRRMYGDVIWCGFMQAFSPAAITYKAHPPDMLKRTARMLQRSTSRTIRKAHGGSAGALFAGQRRKGSRRVPLKLSQTCALTLAHWEPNPFARVGTLHSSP